MSRENRRRTDPEMSRQHRRRWLARFARAGLLGGVTLAMTAGLWWLNGAMRIESWSIEGPKALQVAIGQQLELRKEQLDLIHAWPSCLHDDLLAAIPDLADVSIARQLPNHLQMVAVARRPMALWQDGDQVWLVDDQATAYRKLAASESPDLPLLRVPQTDLAASVELLAGLQTADAGKLAELSEVRTDGSDWRLYFDRGELWMLPQEHDDRLLARLNGILNSPRWKNGTWRVDARASTRWYLRPAAQGGVI
ncbi:MAG TPA: cell division protein FtsQ/DivIB [Mariprofundaceae bacterium]|nr:cell division protein FtsQ/DivIB [Mariprofundaceae bacterium]